MTLNTQTVTTQAKISEAASCLISKRNNNILFALMIILAVGSLALTTYCLATHSFALLSLRDKFLVGLSAANTVIAIVVACFFKKFANQYHKRAEVLTENIPLSILIRKTLKGNGEAKTLFYFQGGKIKDGKIQCSSTQLSKLVKELNKGDERVLEIVRRDRLVLSEKDEIVQSVLFKTAENGNAASLKTLIGLFPHLNFNKQNEEGCTALMLACSAGHLQATKILLQISDLSLIDSQGRTAFMRAAQNGQTAIIQEIIRSFPRLNFNTKDLEGRTALMLASIKGHINATKLLLAICDPNATDKQGRTSLMLALQEGHEKIVIAHLDEIIVFEPVKGFPIPDCFIRNFTNVNHQDKDGNTALMHALGRPALLTALLKKGADPTIPNLAGETPFTLALRNRDCSSLAALIEDPKIEKLINTPYNEGGNTLLLLASQEGNAAFAKILLEKNANPNQVDRFGQSALFFAAAKGFGPIVELLCQHNANLLQRESIFHQTPLMIAAKMGFVVVVDRLTQQSRSKKAEQARELAKKEEGIDLENKQGETALLLAVKNNKLDTTALLLESGAKNDSKKMKKAIDLRSLSPDMASLLKEGPAKFRDQRENADEVEREDGGENEGDDPLNRSCLLRLAETYKNQQAHA